jgi:hypothetical protein
MAKVRELFEVKCPCCDALLKIDPETRAVIAHKVPEKPPVIEDLAAAVERLKGAPGRRDEAFNKSFAEHKMHGKVLESKFDELLKQAKESPDKGPPRRGFDLD